MHRRKTRQEQLGVLKEGYLLKSPPNRGGTFLRKRWRRRWFILTPRALVYFKSPADGAPKGMVRGERERACRSFSLVR